MKANPQKKASDAMRQRLIVWEHWRTWKRAVAAGRLPKPWRWGQPILAPKPKRGTFRRAPKWVHPYQTKKECRPGINLRVVR